MPSYPSHFSGYRLSGQGDLGCLKLVDNQQTPELEPHQCLIKVHAVSLNYRDLIMITGDYPQKPKDNLIPCSDGAGEVIAIGAGVKQWSVGDKVIGSFHQDWVAGPDNQHLMGTNALGGSADGMLSQLVVLPADGLSQMPAFMTYEQASTLPCAALTAWNAFFGLEGKSRLLPGQSVLVQGTGGVSVFGAQIALASGCRVIITSSSDDKLEEITSALMDPANMRASGEVHTVNYKKFPAWDEEVRRITGGAGVDHILEVGGAATIETSFKSLRYGGTITSIGFLGRPKDMPDVAMLALSNAAVLRGVIVGSRSQLADMCRLFTYAKIKPFVGQIFAFEDAAKAFEAMKTQTVVGKIVITVSE